MTAALEFFSGMGGMHHSLNKSKLPFSVIAAFDINTNANQVYELNFGIKPIQKNLESITPAFIDKFQSELWLSSPPCQPYTRQGLKLQSKDPRASGFNHLLYLLEHVQKRPKYFFLENVVGFEESDSYQDMIQLLERLGYGRQEYILSPEHLGIPNTRPRFYLLATLGGETRDRLTVYPPVQVKQVREYLEQDPQFIKVEWLRALDPHLVTKPTDTITGCFTKAYGKYGASGTFLQTKEDPKEFTCDGLGLRLFTPEEVRRIHGYPEIKWPESMTTMQQYRLLGNSVSVDCICFVLVHAITPSLS
ncbi:S-adenosyl-L-methionine-dependent methyltransferase [Gorgonomyces haynaldii]|nr:S-adenosyl-L-methionine-dependent methyltransferase [Gorgonomyces haynaldii]